MGPFLSPGGSLAALAVGAAVTLGAGWPGLGALLAFFLSSSLLTPGGGRRGAAQVAANGGVAAAAALLSLVHPLWRVAFAGALAAAAADTWSTEIGGRSRARPRLLATGRRVSAGTSGGVTWLGTAGGAAGAAFLACVAAGLGAVRFGSLAPVAVAGVVAGGVDSVLGATLQARYLCSACGATGEVARHSCGREAALVSGLRWMTNDTVNLAATVAGAAVAALPALTGAAHPTFAVALTLPIGAGGCATC